MEQLNSINQSWKHILEVLWYHELEALTTRQINLILSLQWMYTLIDTQNEETCILIGDKKRWRWKLDIEKFKKKFSLSEIR